VNSALGTITPKALALNAATDTKVYDGGTSSVGVVTAGGLVGGDTVTALSQSFASKNVLGVNGSTLNVSGGYAVNDGNGGNNYAVTLNSATGTITPKALALNGVTDTKVYDGGTSSTGMVTTGGLVGGDTVTALSQSFASKNVLGVNGSTLNVNGGYAVNDGNGGNNYAVTLNTATGTITPKALALNAVTDTKVYDGTTGSPGAVATGGLAGGDTVGSLSQSFASKNVLGINGSTLNVNGGYLVNDGNGGNNYTVTLNSALGTITPAPVNLAASRLDNGTTNFAAGSFNAVVTGTAGSETLTIASGNGTVPSPAIGTQTLMTGTLLLGNGNGGGLASNYTLAGGAHTGTITASIVVPPPVVITQPPAIAPPPDTPATVEASTNYVIYAANAALPTTIEPAKPVTKQPPKQLPNCR
jgi:hypothetical protein